MFSNGIDFLPFFCSNFQGGVFMGFSITSAVMGGIIIICYSIVIAINRDGYYYDRYDYYDDSYRTRNIYNAKMAISAIILVLGIAEFVIGIWAAICCCVMNVCCAPQQVGFSTLYYPSPLISCKAVVVFTYGSKEVGDCPNC